MTQSGEIVSIYKSRAIILELLRAQAYNTEDYDDFSVTEVNSLVKNKQLDMLLTKDSGDKKTYIKYHLAKTLRPNHIYEYIEDLFNLEEVLTKKDDILIIMKDEPNETLIKLLKNIWQQEGIFIIIFNIKRLQFNPLNHVLVPPHSILSEEDDIAIRKRYNIMHDDQLPAISRFSPIAQAIGIRPGKICKIVRPSKTAITTNFYRICSS